MKFPTGVEILTAPWTAVNVLSQGVLAVQVFAAMIGLVPSSRRALRQVSWFVALVVGPPLLWLLCAMSFGVILSFDSLNHFSYQDFYAWLMLAPIVIGATVVLQLLLARQYAEGFSRSLPMLGIVFALLAIFADVFFLTLALTPP